ncbi:MAG: hypothetical protein B7Z29_09200 [Hyphomicrobium sp. 12-62-95]|jgi:hypothetical protein|nr:MAG: hypothetical protein B7Z29_09200 [Hyphomicrobium sp. 12-62-95]
MRARLSSVHVDDMSLEAQSHPINESHGSGEIEGSHASQLPPLRAMAMPPLRKVEQGVTSKISSLFNGSFCNC